ncbi:hypothetical protein OTU49_017312 [Cherax quadricarinatus]|uniref:Uncharacterized protein n=1 Tax=Cherax quadricarinatus TaxID=27406 RepID=A0AAW0XNS2_CHEQU
MTPAGSYIVRIHQIAQIPFCPPLGWSLNQIFNFSHDFSGWEYVVSQWEWGNMVVQGEFGSSPLEWYQKTFAFSLDQAAPLPSTHIILDFRDFSKFMLKVRWPTLATNLAASLNMQDGHYFLQVKKVDEFQGEEAGDVLVWVQGEETREGSLVVSWNLDTDKILALLTSAVTLLNQATSHPGMCGDTLDKHTFSQALQKLLGQNPACLWEKLLLQGHHLLGWVNGATKLQYLWKKLMEEHSQGKSKSSSNYNEDSSQQEVWEHIWTAAKMMGVLEEISESAKVVVVVTKRVQGYWNLLQKLWELVAENQGKCSVPYQLSTFIEELASQLKIFLPSQT